MRGLEWLLGWAYDRYLPLLIDLHVLPELRKCEVMGSEEPAGFS